jgi:hypothetical protein
MRFLFTVLLIFIAGCNSHAQCNCPDGTSGVAVTLPCGTTQATMVLSGVCAGTGTEQNGALSFFGTSPGSCHVALTFSNGTTFSTDVEFAGGEWLACGSDPHGCGQVVFPMNLPGGEGSYTLSAGSPCTTDAAVDGDATSEQ